MIYGGWYNAGGAVVHELPIVAILPLRRELAHI